MIEISPNMALKLVLMTNHVLLLAAEIDLPIDTFLVLFPPSEACLFLLLLFNYSCMPSLPIPPPHPSRTPLPPPPPLSPLILSICPLSPLLTVPSPLPPGYCEIVLNFNVSGYILFAFFLLLIMFQLKVRSYSICPSPPGLFHLT